MTLIERLGMQVLFRMQPETAHDLSIKALASGLVPGPGGPVTSPRLTMLRLGRSISTSRVSANPIRSNSLHRRSSVF